MLSEILKQSPQYITKDTITINGANLQRIGFHPTFDNMQSHSLFRVNLHLTNNKIKSLDGIQQFSKLKYLSIANNQIESIAEFNKVSKTLENLRVLNNPFTFHIDSSYKLITLFPNLQSLDGEKVNHKLNQEYKVKMETFAPIILQYIKMHLDQDLKLIISNRNLVCIEKIIKIIDYLLQNRKSILEEIAKQEDQHSIWKHLFQHIVSFQRNNFNSNSIFEFFVNQAMQQTGIDLIKFSDDQEYFNQQVEMAYLQYNSPNFPIFPANPHYNLGILDFIYQSQISKLPTQRRQEDRIQLASDKQMNKGNNKQIQQQQQKQQQQQQQQQQQSELHPSTLKAISEYKQLYPCYKGLLKLQQLIKTKQFQHFLEQLNLKKMNQQKSGKQLHQSLLKITAVMKFFNQRMFLRQFKKFSKLYKMTDALVCYSLRQRLDSLKHIRTTIRNQIYQANQFRTKQLKKKAFKILKNWIFDLGRQIKLNLLRHKLQSIKRIGFQMIKVAALQNKLEEKQFLEMDMKIPKKRKSKRGFMESDALETFKLQRHCGLL